MMIQMHIDYLMTGIILARQHGAAVLAVPVKGAGEEVYLVITGTGKGQGTRAPNAGNYTAPAGPEGETTRRRARVPESATKAAPGTVKQ